MSAPVQWKPGWAAAGCFKGTASKHVYYLGWNRSPAQVGCMRQVLRPGALGRPRGIGWRGRWERGSGWGVHVYPWLIHVYVWQKPLQCCKVISLQLIKKNKKEKKKKVISSLLAKLCLCHCPWSFSSCGEHRGSPGLAHGLPIAGPWVRDTGAGCLGFSSGHAARQLWCMTHVPRSTWDRLRPGIESVSSALAGIFLTTEPPEKSWWIYFLCVFLFCK